VSELPSLVEECLRGGEKAIGGLFTFVTFCEASIELSPFTAKAPDIARDMTRRSGVKWGEGGLERMEDSSEAVKRGLQRVFGVRIIFWRAFPGSACCQGQEAQHVAWRARLSDRRNKPALRG
jgi:hypothetical protein